MNAQAPAAQTAAAAVKVHRDIAAPADIIFDAWLDAESLTGWLHPVPTTHCTATLDAREGGGFEIVMYLDGKPLPHTGRYIRIARHTQLVFTWASPATQQQETLVTVDFEEKQGNTRVTVTHEKLPENRETACSHHDGWTDALRQLDELATAKAA